MSHADDVRKHCKDAYIDPARNTGLRIVHIRSGDVHAAMGYRNRYPLVCAALGSKIFEDINSVKRIAIDGPVNGANTNFVFQLL